MTDSRRELLSNVDSAWLRMETPTNLMTITVLLTFARKVSFHRLKADVEDRLLPFARFRQRVVAPLLPFARPYWEEDPHFSLRSHLHRLALPRPADHEALQEVIGEMMSTPLDFSKPLWQMHLVEDYRGGSALVTRVHHCIADGIALVRLMLSLVEDAPDRRGRERPWRAPGQLPPGLALPAGAKLRQRTSLLHEGWEVLLHPGHAVDLAVSGASAATELGKLLTMTSDPATALKGPLGVVKRAVWSDPVPLEGLRAAGRRLRATINDVLLTAVTGALRAYLLERGGVAPGLTIRAVVPVNLRADDERDQLGNRFGLVFLPLPVGRSRRGDRLAALKRAMDGIKSSPQAMVAFGVLNALGLASPSIESLGVSIFARKATAVMTNVPGPQQRLYLAGAPIDSIMFWVPQSGRLGLGVSIMSYDGQVRLGLAADAGLVPDPGAILAHFHRELEALARPPRRRVCNDARGVLG